MTNTSGQATFYTIYPGWYTGRATHIHIKVHINGTYVDASGVYTGGHVSHTGKINIYITKNKGMHDLYISDKCKIIMNSKNRVRSKPIYTVR